MTRPDDALFRIRIETFALVRTLLPIALLAGALVGPLYRFEPTIAMWISAPGVLLVLAGVLLASRLPLYPAHAFGIEYRLEEEPFETGRRECVRCDTLAESGTHRRYARQIVVLGIPLHTLEWGSNDYCGDCLGLADGVTSGGDPDRSPAGAPSTGRHTTADPDRASGSGRPTGSNRTPNAGGTPDPGAEPAATAATHADPDTPRLESARRVDRSDETTALELRRAFE